MGCKLIGGVGNGDIFKATKLGWEDFVLKLGVESMSWILLETGED